MNAPIELPRPMAALRQPQPQPVNPRSAALAALAEFDRRVENLRQCVHWLVEHEINPQLAQHRGNVALQEVTADGVVVLRFGGGCHGCGMVDVTLKQGIERTLMEKVPGVTAVRDATDHDTGAAPFIPRDGAGSESGTSPLGAA